MNRDPLLQEVPNGKAAEAATKLREVLDGTDVQAEGDLVHLTPMGWQDLRAKALATMRA